jgi:hypothetical protein
MPLLLRKDGTWYWNDEIREYLRAQWEASVAEDPEAALARVKASVKADMVRTAKHQEGKRKDEAKAAEDRLLSHAIRAAEAERLALEAKRMEKRKAIEAVVAQRRKEEAEKKQVPTAETLRHLQDAMLNIRARQAPSTRDEEEEDVEARRARLASVFDRMLAAQAGNSNEEELQFLFALHAFMEDKQAFDEWEDGQTLQLVGGGRLAALWEPP